MITKIFRKELRTEQVKRSLWELLISIWILQVQAITTCPIWPARKLLWVTSIIALLFRFSKERNLLGSRTEMLSLQANLLQHSPSILLSETTRLSKRTSGRWASNNVFKFHSHKVKYSNECLFSTPSNENGSNHKQLLEWVMVLNLTSQGNTMLKTRQDLDSTITTSTTQLTTSRQRTERTGHRFSIRSIQTGTATRRLVTKEWSKHITLKKVKVQVHTFLKKMSKKVQSEKRRGLLCRAVIEDFCNQGSKRHQVLANTAQITTRWRRSRVEQTLR